MRRRSPGLLAWIVVAAGVAATAASAADLPVPAAAPQAYRPVPVYDWGGIYVGGQVGGGWMNDVVTATTTTAFQPTGAQSKVTAMGVLGGAEAGVNVQFAPVVLGIEGTWTATNISGTQVSGSLVTGNSQQSTEAAPWYATATVRAGYAANDLLFYVKGGAAWVHADHTQAITFGGLVTQQLLSDNRAGWTAGGGFEYGLNENLTLKLEYDYLGFGTKNYTYTGLAFANVGTGGTVTGTTAVPSFPVSIKSSTQMLTVGVNYRFTWR